MSRDISHDTSHGMAKINYMKKLKHHIMIITISTLNSNVGMMVCLNVENDHIDKMNVHT